MLLLSHVGVFSFAQGLFLCSLGRYSWDPLCGDPTVRGATPDPAALRVRFWCLQSLGNLSFLLFSLRDLWPYTFALMSSRLHLALKTIPVSEQLCSVSPRFPCLWYAWQCESVNLKYLRTAFWSMEHSLKSIPPKRFHYCHFELLNSMWERTVKIVLKMFRSKFHQSQIMKEQVTMKDVRGFSSAGPWSI